MTIYTYKYLTMGGRQALIQQYIAGVTIKEALKKEINILLENEGKPKKYDIPI
ncbi:MAG: hypothetical protein KKF62_15895 [Bacteroidetes bacterium]|nr:hypothetical protein [Bacteroidota bacterium]MBU1114664.1 hypothetical protein [Bacteroidota bacterium]MBU1798978.1 hypothetical protein [Bacteroidota bacterium]